MNNRTFYNEVLTDHNRYPGHKEKLADANLVLEGVNPSRYAGLVRIMSMQEL